MRKIAVSLVASALLVSAAGATAEQPATVQFLNSGKVVPTNLPFSEAVRVDNTLYLSGQIGIVPGTLKLVPGGLREEARQAMENIRTTLEANGYAMRDVVKCTAMLADISEWAAFNEVYKATFGNTLDNIPVVIVILRTIAIGKRSSANLPQATRFADGKAQARSRRPVHFNAWHDTPVYSREDLAPGMQFDGPAIIEQSDTTTVVEPGMDVVIDPKGNMLVTVKKVN